jgi:DUF971 family protein
MQLNVRQIMSDTRPWPSEIRVSKDRSELAVGFDNGERFTLAAEMLRVLSPSAEVQGHSPEQRVTVPGKRHVKIAQVLPIGNYAVRLVFDDRHDSGIFTWVYLHELGVHGNEKWAGYLAELSAKGLSRG